MTRLSLFLVAGVSALALTSAVQAADLIIEEPVVGVVDVGGNWDGPYIGVFAGYGWGEADHTAAGGVGPLPVGGNDIDLTGWLLGVTAGANVNVSDGVILGIAGDLAWANKTGEIEGGAFDGTTHTVNWEGSLRGVLGFDGGAFMPYVTAGVAFANATRHTELFGGLDADASHIGWTAGAGVQIAATEDLAIDLQYRYSDFGAQVYDFSAGTDPEIALTQHQFTVGLNWQF